MPAPASKLIQLFLKPHYQAALAAGLIIVFTLVDLVMPHNNTLFEVNAGTWIVATAMILSYVILNSVVAIRIEPVLPYFRNSIYCYFSLLAFAYGWSLLLTGKHIDDVGSFRWLWLVLTLVYMVFFTIARSIKQIMDFAIKQDKKLRGEE
jgi:hypothetical protein